MNDTSESLLSLLILVGTIAQGNDKERIHEAGEIILLTARLANSGSLTLQKLQQIETMVQAMVDEDRPATPEEWATLNGREQTADDRIESVDLSDPIVPEGDGIENVPEDSDDVDSVDATGFNPNRPNQAETDRE